MNIDSKQRLMDRTRVLLDTNIWRYVVDNGCQGDLLRAASKSPYSVQIAPGVLYETFRLKDRSLRASLVKLMVNARFQRLMPEAYSESMEILHEIERLRPGWLRDKPDLQFFERIRKDWQRKTGGFWVRSARTPENEARILSQTEDTMTEFAKKQYDIARSEMISAKCTTIPLLDRVRVGFRHPVPGWNGEEVEAWRVDSWAAVTYGLSCKGNPYRDWLAPFIEMNEGLIYSADWLEFWLYFVDKHTLPRQWIRWAHSFVQRFRKVTHGSPGDNQLCTYFLETDIVVTADKALLEILEICRPGAPCLLPDGKLVPAGKDGVELLLQFLES